MATEPGDIQYIVRNRKARRDFEIISTIEAGIELRGCEVKSIRDGRVNLADSYATVEKGEMLLKNLHISPYEMASGEALDPVRTRRLLLHRREIAKLGAKTLQQGMTLIPLSIYLKRKLVKVELALAIGRKKYDKRQAIAKTEDDRRMKQATKRDLDK